MARYFFNVHDRLGHLRDPEGSELADMEAVRQRAVHDARSLMSADIEEGLLNIADYIEVTDAKGSVVLNLPYSEAVTITGRQPPGLAIMQQPMSGTSS
jgi:hypothetical protein